MDSIAKRGRQAARMLSLVVKLSGRGMTVTEIAAATDVSTKTVRRDIAVLERINVPVYCDRVENSVGNILLWRVDPNWMRRFS